MPSVLFATSEAYPLIKTGGLGDVSGSLPPALRSLGSDIRLILPAYRDAVDQAADIRAVGSLRIAEADAQVELLETTLPGTDVKVWLVAHGASFDRPGNPYLGPDGRPWPDNAARFALFSRAVAAVALGQAGLAWRPEVVHCNDWQTGLVPALLNLQPWRPATVFTIHNMAYQGLFPYATFVDLKLPAEFWSMHALEFHGRLSLIKGGLVFADRLTTVSPNYAREIQTPQFGYGLEGLLRHRAEALVGIHNGIDEEIWNPARDPYLVRRYDRRHRQGKQVNKARLLKEFGMPQLDATPLVGMVSRLVEQKGIDLLVEALHRLLALPLQVVLLGSGERHFEQALQEAARRYPQRLAVHIGYEEALAHRIEAGADMFLMPSRFEPCGLNQLFSLRYGTVPIVHGTGGLADTVVDTNEQTLAEQRATGVVFTTPTAEALLAAAKRALALYRQPKVWAQLVRTGMAQSFGWRDSARQYLALYEEIVPQIRMQGSSG